MKTIVQRVLKASVTVGDEVVSSIGKGLCVLIGISRKDSPSEIEYMVRKLLSLRLFDSDDGKRWDKSVVDKGYDILCVSQFTLMVTMKGNKPDFHEAMGPDLSEQYYEEFLKQMKEAYCDDKVKGGKFGAYMQVHIQNDGPVTIPLDSPPHLQNEQKSERKKQWEAKKQPKSPEQQTDSASSTSVNELSNEPP